MKASEQPERKLTVGVGASAGGLTALKELVSNLPADTGMSFVIIQHLDPSHKSLLVEILAKHSALPIEESHDDQALERDHIYVIPPDAYLELEGERIRLIPPEHQRGSRKAIDHFFTSLARELGDASVGIIMSGSGTDGTAGLRAIRAAGGLTLVQDPDTADHPSMPSSAIDADVVDRVMPVAEMPQLLIRYSHSPLMPKSEVHPSVVETAEESLATITAILKSHEDFNLRQYKPATVQRRIARRMSLAAADDYASYLDLLRSSADERAALTKDLLINVTSFFRDREAFEQLQSRVVPQLLQRLDRDEDLRVWVPGCASGEEAYSVAITLRDALDAHSMTNAIRMFATDVDEHAISKARRGVFLPGVETAIPERLLDKYFVHHRKGGGYRITEQIRESISFAVHDVGHDPPFSRMDLISCRNLLIYMKKHVQERILDSFYFALKDSGYLFLGSSETVSPRTKAFKPVAKKWRIYRKNPGHEHTRAGWQHYAQASGGERRRSHRTASGSPDRGPLSRSELVRRDLLDTFVDPGVVVSSDGHILYNHGDWTSFMAISSGEPREAIGDLVQPAMRSRLRSALYKVRRTRKPLTFYCSLPGKGENAARNVRVDLALLPHASSDEDLAIGILFHEIQEPQEREQTLTSDDELRLNENLGRELAETRDELQNTIEELETSTEELKASHEEALSTNEELQSANEELEASGEELRSLNEELSTVNAQLKEKIEDLRSARDDVANFFESTNIPTVFLNPELEIQRYTPAAERLLDLTVRDIGRPVRALGSDLVAGLADDCRSVLQDFQPITHETSSEDGEWFIRQITPYRTGDRRIEGVVVAFQDVTEIRELSRRAEARERQQSVVASLGLMALSGESPEDLMDNAVRQVAHVLEADYCKVLEYRPADHEFLLVAGCGWQEGLVGQATVADARTSQAGYTLISKRPVIVHDIASEKRFEGPPLLTSHDVVSGMSCVINHADPPYGVLGVHTRKARTFTEEDANFLLSVANLLSVALQTRAAQLQLHDSEQQFRALANSIPQLAWSADETGAITWFNQRWYDYTGTRFEDVKDRGWRKLHHPDYAERVNDKFRESIAAGRAWEDTFPIRGQSGDYRWFLSKAVPVHNADGSIASWFGTSTDITDQLEQETALRASEEKLRLAMKTNEIGTFEFYLQEENTSWDGVLKQIWGIPDDVSPTQAMFWEGVHADDVERVREALAKATAAGSDGHYRSTYRVINRRSGDLYWVEASGQTLFEDGVPTRMVGLVIDITQRKKLEESLQSAVSDLKDAAAKKNEFLAVLGHELRNPLAALNSGVETLALDAAAVDDVLGIMRNSVATMSRLLDDLLDLNRISQDRIHLERRPIDLAIPLYSAIAGLSQTFSARSQKFDCEVGKGIMVDGDATRLEQVFVNLLANASKYTPSGGKIRITAERDDDSVEIAITDTGIGVARKHLEAIFEPFFQVRPKGSVGSGLGIGLALSRKLVELHDGTLTAESGGKNAGTRITMRLPVSQTQTVSTGSAAGGTPVRPGIKVVLIDDNEDLLKTLPRLLRTLQCEVTTASTGEQGMERVAEASPDAVLLDIGLPDMNGYEVASSLRAAGYEGLLVAISGYGHEQARELSAAAGIDVHIAKPAGLEEIATTLATL